MKKFDLKNLQGSKRTLRSGSYATVLAVVVLAFVILVNLVAVSYTHLDVYKRQRQYRIILSADTASEVRQLLSQKRR